MPISAGGSRSIDVWLEAGFSAAERGSINVLREILSMDYYEGAVRPHHVENFHRLETFCLTAEKTEALHGDGAMLVLQDTWIKAMMERELIPNDRIENARRFAESGIDRPHLGRRANSNSFPADAATSTELNVPAH
jgi:hypothetical protein